MMGVWIVFLTPALSEGEGAWNGLGVFYFLERIYSSSEDLQISSEDSQIDSEDPQIDSEDSQMSSEDL